MVFTAGTKQLETELIFSHLPLPGSRLPKIKPMPERVLFLGSKKKKREEKKKKMEKRN